MRDDLVVVSGVSLSVTGSCTRLEAGYDSFISPEGEDNISRAYNILYDAKHFWYHGKSMDGQPRYCIFVS